MANKPAQLCQLQKGKFVDFQQGFVDTFNWAVSAIANLKGGENCEVTWTTDDHPTIDCTAVEGDDPVGGGGGGEGGGGGGGGNPITFNGTTGSATPANDQINLACGYDSNITISCSGNTITFNVYYV